MTIQLEAAQGAYLEAPGNPTSKFNPYRVRSYTAAEKDVIGYLVMRGRGRVFDEDESKYKNRTEDHLHEILRRPSESARVTIEHWNQTSEQWEIQEPVQGGSTLCSGCGDSFGQSEQIGELEWKRLGCARYRVNVVDDYGDIHQQDAFFCFKASECNERLMAKVKARQVVGFKTTREALAVDTAYRAAFQELGEDAPLPEGMKRCALESCNRPFIPYTPAAKCCTNVHAAALAAQQRSTAKGAPAAKFKQIRAAQKKSVATQKQKRYDAARAAENADEELIG